MTDLLDKPLFDSKPVQVCDDQWFIQRQLRRPVRAMPHLVSVDDRGKTCSICEDASLQRSRRKIRNAYVEVMSAGKIRRALMYGLLVFLICSMVAVFTQSLNGGDAPVWTIIPIFIWLGVLVVLMLRAQWRASICAALHEHHCPGCNYSLVDIEQNEDECALCPECGSAWKLPHIKKEPVGSTQS